ncbi:Pyridoxal kinase PdxY [subsurface metagenome]
MISKSGAHLLKPEAKDILVDLLLPLATVVTPNAMEAEAISGIKIKCLEDWEKAALKIADLGARSVVIKGGHILEREGQAIDILLHKDEYIYLEAERHEAKDTHGTGCSFSSAIAAELAKGKSVPDAVRTAKQFVNNAIRFGLRIGHGHGPLNPMAGLYNDAEKFRVLENVKKAVKILEGCPSAGILVAEVQMNIGMSLPYAAGPKDIAAIEGRMIRMRGGVRATGCPGYGVSGHVARTILAVREFDPAIRAGMNIRYSEDAIRICKDLGLIISYYDRREEPEEVKAKDGMTTYWGASEAVKRAGRIPDVIYHLGDWGKEPMITLVGKTAVQIANKATEIAQSLTA